MFYIDMKSDGLFFVKFLKPEHAAQMEGIGFYTSTEMVVFTCLLIEEDISQFFQGMDDCPDMGHNMSIFAGQDYFDFVIEAPQFTL